MTVAVVVVVVVVAGVVVVVVVCFCWLTLKCTPVEHTLFSNQGYAEPTPNNANAKPILPFLDPTDLFTIYLFPTKKYSKSQTHPILFKLN